MPQEKTGCLSTDEKDTAQIILWKKMEEELRENFIDYDIKKLIDPIKDWFLLRLEDKKNLEIGKKSSLSEDIRKFDKKYQEYENNDRLNEILGYITNKLGKPKLIIPRK